MLILTGGIPGVDLNIGSKSLFEPARPFSSSLCSEARSPLSLPLSVERHPKLDRPLSENGDQ